jgi:transcriptional regulator with XRE-family HTH domain
MPRGTKRTIPDTIGGRIQKLRLEKGLDQKDVAEALGVKRETVNHWESESRDLKTAYTLALADYFGVTCDYILRGVQSKNVEINKRIGLSDKSIKILEDIQTLKPNNSIIRTINALLENGEILKNMSKYLYYTIHADDITPILIEYSGDSKDLENPASAHRFTETISEDTLRKVYLLEIQTELELLFRKEEMARIIREYEIKK